MGPSLRCLSRAMVLVSAILVTPLPHLQPNLSQAYSALRPKAFRLMTIFGLLVYQTYSTSAPLLSELTASHSWSFLETAIAECSVAP